MSNNMTPRQRREELIKRADSAQEAHSNGTLNGTPRAPATDPADEQTNENIFLFVPNLIGKPTITFTSSHSKAMYAETIR